jgi:hypothetical protein
MSWTDETKQKVIESYTNTMQNEYNNDADRAQASVEVVKELSEDFGETVNRIRMCLVKAGVYVKKAPAKKATTTATGGATRINKAEAQQELKTLITQLGGEVDEDIVSKLTGKAAAYLSGVLALANTGE